VKKALAALPWVEYRSIDTDREARTVRFGVNDLKSFSADALRDALGERYGNEMEVVKGPETK
jgi:hypothetical protein